MQKTITDSARNEPIMFTAYNVLTKGLIISVMAMMFTKRIRIYYVAISVLFW